MRQSIDEVYSLLIPVGGGKLILPRLSVAEVMGYGRPAKPPAGPEWVLAMVNWEGLSIPLISFEGACGHRIPESSSRTRVAVVYAIAGVLDPPAFAIMTQGYPYLVRVNPMVLAVNDEIEIGEDEPILNRVRMANERPIIPDLEALEYRLAEALGQRIPTADAEV